MGVIGTRPGAKRRMQKRGINTPEMIAACERERKRKEEERSGRKRMTTRRERDSLLQIWHEAVSSR